jgi:hypothetical protein
MKTVPPSEYGTKDLKFDSIILTSLELYEVCEKLNRLCGPIGIVKELPDGSKLVYENLEEVANHLSSIQVPFVITTSGPKIDFWKLGVNIQYKRSESNQAATIFSILRLYSPFYLNYSGRVTTVLLLLGLSLAYLIRNLADSVLVPGLAQLKVSELIMSAFVMMSLGIQVYSFPIFGLLVRIRHVRKDTFFQRNRDKFALSVLSFILGIAATYVLLPVAKSLLQMQP